MKISIITAVFNAEQSIERCVQSVASQDGCAEHLLIDNKSTDRTVELARKANPNIRIISEPDHGIYDAMNKGAGLASGGILAWLNADDCYLPGTLAKVTQFFESHPDTDLLHGNIQVDGRCTRPSSGIASFRGTRVFHPAAFVRRESFFRFGPYDLQYKICADLNFFMTAGEQGARFAYMDEPLTDFALGGLSTRKRKETAQEVRQILIRHGYGRLFAELWYYAMRGRGRLAELFGR